MAESVSNFRSTKMNLRALIFLIFCVKAIWSQNCPLSASNMDKKWIYAVKPTAVSWDVLRTDFIQNQQTLYKICSSSLIVQLLCNRGTLQQHPPNADCSRRIKATVDAMNRPCYSYNMTGIMYEVHYTLPDGTVVPLYQVCYDTVGETPLYSYHRAYGFNLAAASSYRRPQFTQDKVVTRERAASFEAQNIYATFQTLLGPQQKYINSSMDLILERGHLANSQDFPSYDQMDETFKYVNVMPQFRGSNRSNWKRIENWINNLASALTYAEVVTGTYGILQLPHSRNRKMIPIYLQANQKNPVPLWTYKLVKYNGQCYAFITLNNDFNTNALMSAPLCQTTTCPLGLEFNQKPGNGVSFCCNYQQFVNNLGIDVKLC